MAATKMICRMVARFEAGAQYNILEEATGKIIGRIYYATKGVQYMVLRFGWDYAGNRNIAAHAYFGSLPECLKWFKEE